MLPSDFSERQRQDEEEMTEMTGANNDGRITIPGSVLDQTLVTPISQLLTTNMFYK